MRKNNNTFFWDDRKNSPNNLILPGKHIKFEVGDIVIASQIDRRFQSHCLQTRADRVGFVQGLPENFPCNYGSEI